MLCLGAIFCVRLFSIVCLGFRGKGIVFGGNLCLGLIDIYIYIYISIFCLHRKKLAQGFAQLVQACFAVFCVGVINLFLICSWFLPYTLLACALDSL